MIYTRNPQGSWECHTRGNTTSLDCNEQQQKKDKESFLIPKTLQGGNRLILLLSGIHIITFYKKKEKSNSGGGTTRQEGGTSSSDCRAGMWTHCSQSLKPDHVCLDGFWNCLGSVAQLLFSSLPFWHEVSATAILCQSYYCLLGTASFLVSWVQN